MKKRTTALILLSLVAAGAADAQSRLRDAAPPLTIQRRSFLDSGKQVPVGSLNRYMQQMTQLARPAWSTTGVPGLYGYDALPRRFDPPGRPQPLLEFSTGSGGP